MSPVVLIVDDSLTVRMDLAQAFETDGFTPTTVATLADARAALDRQAADIIVLDVMLPDGDGVDLLAELRTRPALADAIILMLSTEAEVGDRVRGIRGGADEYIGKPYDTRHVIAKSRELLRARGNSRAPSSDSATILLIDADPHHLADVLRAEDYDLITAVTGEEGLRVAADRRPEAIIVDSSLPDIDGPTVIRRLRLDAALRDVPCLMLTAADDQSAEPLALDAGADAFIRKGDAVVLLARLAAVLRTTDRAALSDDAASLLGPSKLLLIDHDAARADLLATPLRADGYDVILARSGDEALHLVVHQPVECLLLDPTTLEVDAAQACQSIRAAAPDRTIPVIVVGDHSDQFATIRSLAAGADDVVARSDPPDVIKARIRSQIRRKRSDDYNHHIRTEFIRRDIAAAEARAAQQVAEARAALAEELEQRNRELESFSYSVSHDLRNPLHSVIGFNQLLLDARNDLDEEVTNCIRITLKAAARMAELIDDLLKLSDISGAELDRGLVDVSALTAGTLAELRQRDPSRPVTAIIQPDVTARADARLVRILIDNLLGNAWKYTGHQPNPILEFGQLPDRDPAVYFLRDNGAGFDMAQADRLFRPFARLHSPDQFPGTGIGLATVRRIVDRHGGQIWAEGAPGQGATFYFSLLPGGDLETVPAGTLVDLTQS
jgi:two-component system NtrC family sensor kinase